MATGSSPRYIELAKGFGLAERQRLKTLSKGTRAKVSLSLAMANDPELLVLDEPTSGLDAMVRREFLESMVDRAAGGQTVLLSSHQIAEVERVADVVAILREGQLLLVERLDELKGQIRELTITLADGAGAPPELPGRVLSARLQSRQWQGLLRGATDDQVASLRAHPSVGGVEVRQPSLEEIFVAYMKGGAKSDREDVVDGPVDGPVEEVQTP